MMVAHAGHWLVSLGFAGPPVLLVLALVVMGVRERRREGAGEPDDARLGERVSPSA